MAGKFALILIFVSVAGYVKGQTLPDERVLVKTDREIYLCGEKVYFNAWTYDGDLFIPVTFSSILYAELYNTDNLVISRTKILLVNGKGTGWLDIPRNVMTGIYYLRAYTNYMKNFGFRQFYLGKLKLVNPFNKAGSVEVNKNDRSAVAGNPDPLDNQGNTNSRVTYTNNPVKTLNIKLLPDKNTYRNREEVKVTVNVTDRDGLPVKTGLAMMAVLSENETSGEKYLPGLFRTTVPDKADNIRNLVSPGFLPEIYGDIISGKLIYTDGKPAVGVELQQSFTGPAGCIESVKTDENGRFYFLAENEKNRGDLIIRICDPASNLLLIPDNEFFDLFPAPQSETLMLSPDETDLVAKQFVNIQVEDAFSGPASKKVNFPEQEQVPFYGKDFSEYTFSDYAQLPNMKEFIFEVIVGVVVLKENRKDAIAVLDAGSSSSLGPDPLIMIDGVPVADVPVVLGLDPEKVKTVRVVRSRYFYKKKIFDGILDILTNEGNARSVPLPENTYRYGFIHAEGWKKIAGPDLPQSDDGQIPVYKNLLYLNPDIETDAGGKAEVTFYTPDNSGQYIIECFGFTPDGLAGEGRCLIRAGEK